MDNLSSSELDSPSKTPLFIAIAAVIVAVVGLGLGWMGLSRSKALEDEIAQMRADSNANAELEAAVQANTERLDKASANMATLSKNVSDALGEVSNDLSKVRSDIRKVTIDALTAKKMVEELEEKGVQVSVVPSPSSGSSASPAANSAPAEASAPDAPPGKGGVYTIKSGDTLGRIAEAYKISLSQLLAANPGIDPRRLRIGQQISVPAP